MDRQRSEWLARFPRTATELWQWCLTQEQETLLRLLAFLTASSLNAIQSVRTNSGDTDGKGRIQHADAIAAALNVDMTLWFTPTAENFFGRVSKAQTLSAFEETGKDAPDAAKLKKAELAAVAEKELGGTGWLPAPVRIAALAEENRNGDHTGFGSAESVAEEEQQNTEEGEGSVASASITFKKFRDGGTPACLLPSRFHSVLPPLLKTGIVRQERKC